VRNAGAGDARGRRACARRGDAQVRLAIDPVMLHQPAERVEHRRLGCGRWWRSRSLMVEGGVSLAPAKASAAAGAAGSDASWPRTAKRKIKASRPIALALIGAADRLPGHDQPPPWSGRYRAQWQPHAGRFRPGRCGTRRPFTPCCPLPICTTTLSEATEPAAMIAALDAWFDRVAGAMHAEIHRRRDTGDIPGHHRAPPAPAWPISMRPAKARCCRRCPSARRLYLGEILYRRRRPVGLHRHRPRGEPSRPGGAMLGRSDRISGAVAARSSSVTFGRGGTTLSRDWRSPCSMRRDCSAPRRRSTWSTPACLCH
jgi:hypothetical protein